MSSRWYATAAVILAVALAAAHFNGSGGGEPGDTADAPQEWVAGNTTLEPVEHVEPLEVVTLIDSEAAGTRVPFEGFDAFNLNLADVNGDGNLTIVTFNDNARAYVLDPLTGHAYAEIGTHHPGGIDSWHRQTLNGIAVGDVDGNGATELAVLNTAAYLTLLEYDAANSTGDAYAFHERWRQFVSAPEHDSGFFEERPWFHPDDFAFGAHGHAFIADVEDSGGAWVFAQSDDWPGQFAFDAHGNLRWMSAFWDGHAGPWVGKLREDGPPRALYATDNGRLGMFDARSGELQWVFDANERGVHPGSIPVMPLVVDMDGDGGAELFVGTRMAVPDADDPDWMYRQNARYFLLDADGGIVWERSFPWGNPLAHMQPVPFDVNGDGVLDLVVMDWNTIGHKPGDWERLGPAHVFALDGTTGDVLWRTSVDMAFSRGNVAVADVLPDETGPEILVPDRQDGRDGLSLVGIVDGEKRAWFPVPDGNWTLTRGPALADVDGDDLVEVVAPLARPGTDCVHPDREDVGCREGALVVYRSTAEEGDVWWSNNIHYNRAHDRELDPWAWRARAAD